MVGGDEGGLWVGHKCGGLGGVGYNRHPVDLSCKCNKKQIIGSCSAIYIHIYVSYACPTVSQRLKNNADNIHNTTLGRFTHLTGASYVGESIHLRGLHWST